MGCSLAESRSQGNTGHDVKARRLFCRQGRCPSTICTNPHFDWRFGIYHYILILQTLVFAVLGARSMACQLQAVGRSRQLMNRLRSCQGYVSTNPSLQCGLRLLSERVCHTRRHLPRNHPELLIECRCSQRSHLVRNISKIFSNKSKASKARSHMEK